MKERQSSLAAFRTNAARARSLSELDIAFRSFVRGFGFTAYAVGRLPDGAGSDEPFLLLDWPQTWLELYAREGFAREDAVVAAAVTAREPFTWSELQRRQPGASARIFAAARLFGWTDGLLVPVHAAGGNGLDLAGIASLAAGRLDGFGSQERAVVADGAGLAFFRAVAMSEPRAARPLSERERDALTMVAAGHSDREIAAAFQISIATAHFHVEQAKRKLGAVTRAQAVALAVAQGFVSVCSRSM